MPDIIVGGRRSHPHRNLRGIALAIVLFSVCALAAHFIYERVVSYDRPSVDVPDHSLLMIEDTATDAGTRLGFGDSSLSYAGTIAVVRARGEPPFLGVAHGRLLGGAVSEAMASFDANIAHTVPRTGLVSELSYPIRLRWRYRFADAAIPGHQLIELAGMLQGARRTAGTATDYGGFLREQVALDVGVPAPWSSNASFRTMTRALSFVTTLRGTSGERLFVGRSFALPGAADGGDAIAERLTLSFMAPDGVIPFASVGWPGMAGVVSGINAESIAVMVHPVHTRDVAISRQAQPIPLLARDVLENARTLDEAVSILKHATPLGAAAFLIADGRTRTWAVVERSPTKFAVTRDPTPAVVTDVLDSEVFADDPENDRARRIQPATMRKRRAARLLRRRVAEPGDVVALLRDVRDPADQPLTPGHRGALYDAGAVHAAVFDVSGMVLWVADGASAGARFRAFDLRYELRGAGARPAPPPDVPADPELDGSVARRVRLARRALRAARRARHHGRRHRAREMVQRALAYAPTLPEALKLAGDLARAARDTEASTRYYQRFLEMVPDDIGDEAEVRAILDQ